LRATARSIARSKNWARGDTSDNPAGIVAKAGYRLVAQASIIGGACELGALWIPRVILNTALRWLRDGYRAYVFEAIR
jgi:hypothetical protein